MAFPRRLGLPLALSMILLGISLEFFQRLVPGRAFDWLDILANTLGVLSGIVLAPPHAFGVDDTALTLVSLPNPVPIGDHFNPALLGTSSPPPKLKIRGSERETDRWAISGCFLDRAHSHEFYAGHGHPKTLVPSCSLTLSG
jgi:hypothetical protein